MNTSKTSEHKPASGVGWSVLLGGIDWSGIDWSALRIGGLLCIAYGGAYVWCALSRILASLYEMKCLQEEWNSEHNQCVPSVRVRNTGGRFPLILAANYDKDIHLQIQRTRATSTTGLSVKSLAIRPDPGSTHS